MKYRKPVCKRCGARDARHKAFTIATFRGLGKRSFDKDVQILAVLCDPCIKWAEQQVKALHRFIDL